MFQKYDMKDLNLILSMKRIRKADYRFRVDLIDNRKSIVN